MKTAAMALGGKFRVLVVLFILMLAYACGYAPARKGGALKGLESISVPVFKNLTQRAAIEAIATQAMIEEFSKILKIDDAAPEAVVEGAMVRYELTPVSFDRSDIAREYRLTVEFTLSLLKDGMLLWQDTFLDYEDFTVSMADVLTTRDAELSAFRKIALDTARTVVEAIIAD